ncbi:cellulose biosynthesis protein BcsC [Roseomonas elaeocarpi]|uniref:Cellulose synthase subunit BcsC-related outer membrane protein n=1 Tax=Roseomonas elaeocarpi TaxID=907779 RepID=A0ABV6JUT7_9PROT
MHPAPSRFALALLSGCAIIPAWVATGNAQEVDRGVQVLLDQAKYWQAQNRPDQALRVLQRALVSAPQNPDALAAAAEAAAQQGDRQQADNYTARLRRLAPNDPRVSRTETQVRGASADPARIAEARRLAQSGHQAEAVAIYRQLFAGGTPPDNYAVEYYQTLAGVPENYAEGRNGLESVARSNPSNARNQLAYAQTLTWREASRAEGIRRLEQLSQDPTVGAQARAAWRDALGWEGASPAAAQGLESYLQRFPDDQQARQRLDQARNPPRTPQDELATLRQTGFDALNGNRVAAAQDAFQNVLNQSPQDPDALGGLGLVRLRQGRNAEARQLLSRAIAGDPQDGRRKWGRALAGASDVGVVNAARSQLARGQTDQAIAALERASRQGGGEQPDADTLLGDIALRQGDATGAEQRYRAALARRPNLPGALSGLYDALQAQGRFAEAEQLAAQRGASFANAAAATRAEQLRAEAQRTADPEAAAALLRVAVASNPDDPWTRLDLARALVRQGRGAEGRAVMDELVGRNASADALYASALLAQEEGRSTDAASYVERIPVRLRTADASRLLRTAQTEREIAAAAEPLRYGRPDLARQRLLQIATRPDPTGDAAAQAVRVLGNAGDRQGAAEVARVALATNRAAGPGARIALAGAMLEAGLAADAAPILSAASADPRLSADDRRQLAGLQTGFAIRSSDQLNEAGDQAAAYDRLAPALRANPQDPAANLALARLYQGARQPEQAQQIAEAVLQRDPRNADARLAAANAAVAARDSSRAEQLLAEGRALTPNDPRISILEAQIARAQGDSLRARAALERAAEQRRAQLGVSPDLPTVPGSPAATTTAVASSGGNPFRTAALAGSGTASLQLASSTTGPGVSDPLLTDIDRQLAQVREEAASRLTPNFAARFRSGSSGLDKLREFSGGVESSAAMPGIGGRITARAQAYTLDAGNLGSDTASLRRFGTNGLSLGGTTTAITADAAQRYQPTDSTASGVALGIGYTRDNVSLDVGSTPLGFRQQNLVGGVELAPGLTDNLRLRVTGERRAVTDSLLSWAGQKDPLTGRSWGGVVRNTGRGQLEYTVGDTSFYAGGGYSSFEGKGVADNTRVEAGAGLSQTIFRRPDSELTAGLDLVYFGYDKNLRFFTAGQGGYFSPQNFVAANIPVDYRQRIGNLAYRLGGQIGVAHFKEDRSEVFPDDPGLQAAAVAQAATDSTKLAYYPGQTKTTVVGGVRLDLEYSLTPQLRLGGLLRYDRSADWNETRGMLFARYRFE